MSDQRFSLAVAAFADKTRARLDVVVRLVSLEAFRRVVFRTPVDTGRARGNWQLSIGSIPTDTIELDDASGEIVISQAAANAAGIKAGDIVYLVNNLPYIRPLEYGWSDQAPAGMVRPTIAEMQAWLGAVVDAARREVR